MELILIIHGLLRHAALLLLAVLASVSLSRWIGKKEFSSEQKKLSLFTMISFDLQIFLGLILYSLSPTVRSFFEDFKGGMKVKELRFFGMEHIALMILSAVLIHLCFRTAKKAEGDVQKKIALFSLGALVLTLAGIPWFRPLFRF